MQNSNTINYLSQDKHLRSRVRLFGNLLGNVLREHAGPEVFAIVEELRKGFIRLRKEPNPALKKKLGNLIDSLDPETTSHVLRAFSLYFSLINIAEEAHMHHVRRQQVRKGGPLWRGSFDDTLKQFMVDGLSAEELQKMLDQLAYIPVFTAHPTEAKRRTIMQSLRRIFLTAEKLADYSLSRNERREVSDTLQNQIQVLWKTNEVRVHRPEVRGEIRNGLFYFRECLFAAVPQVYRNFEDKLYQSYGLDENGKPKVKVPSFLRFGSWIGGDRDGNPFVKPETTETALMMHMREILMEYHRRVKELSGILTYGIRMTTISDALASSLEQNNSEYADAFADRPKLFSEEPYRRKLEIIKYRLSLNIAWVDDYLDGNPSDINPKSFRDEYEFLDELRLIHDSLYSHGDGNIADGKLRDLIRLGETFGFFLVHLDIRQESTVHSNSIAEIFKTLGVADDYLDQDVDGRVRLLNQVLENDSLELDSDEGLSDMTVETINVFRLMKRMQQTVSPNAFGQYVISMTHNVSHILEVMVLGKLAGLVQERNGEVSCQLNISPLFETIEDLTHIEEVLDQLYSNKTYRKFKDAAGGIQEAMLGYSDSCKDGGILASGWSLYNAQKKILALSDKHNIRCRLFHGRGGTIGRGGGPTHESILAQPPNTVHGQIRFTEQGEVLSYKYSNLETAVYELTMGVTGLMKASTCLVKPQPEDRKDYLGIMDEIAAAGEKAYRQLTDETPHFLDYFYESTPVSEIGLMNIGSRPSHRKKTDRSKGSIRAIPWVFGWAQARHTLPAWYGLGHALDSWRDNDPARLAKLQTMYREWPFFQSLLGNSQMALFKGELSIAEEYSNLYDQEDIRKSIYGTVRDEYLRTIEHVLNIANMSNLLEENPVLSLSLTRRDPYLDPLNYIQIKLLREYRADLANDNEDSVWLDPLLRSINAISAGMRNTG